MRALPDCDEWGQCVLLDLLLRYCCAHFPGPTADCAGPAAATPPSRAFPNETQSTWDASTEVRTPPHSACAFGPDSRSPFGGTASYGGVSSGGCFYDGCGGPASSRGSFGGGEGWMPRTSSRSSGMSDGERANDGDAFYSDIPSAPTPTPRSGASERGLLFGAYNRPDQSGGSVAAGATPAESAERRLCGGGAGAHAEIEPLLRAARTLLSSRNSGVVTSSCALILQLSTPPHSACVARPLCRLARSAQPEVAYGALQCIVNLSTTRAELFLPHIRDFFVSAADPLPLSRLRLSVLTSLASEGTISLISHEISAHLRSSSEALVRLAVKATAECASRVPAVAERCLQALLGLLTCGCEETVAETVTAIRSVLQSPQLHTQPRVVARLAAMLPDIHLPQVRARPLPAPPRRAVRPLWARGPLAASTPFPAQFKRSPCRVRRPVRPSYGASGSTANSCRSSPLTCCDSSCSPFATSRSP